MPPPGCACAAAGGAPQRMEAAGGLLARARARRPEAVRLRKRRSVLYGAPGGPAGQRGAGKRGGEGRAVAAALGGTLDSQPSPPQALPAGQRRCWRSRWRCGRSTASSSRPASSRTSTGSRWRWRTAWSSNILRGPPPRCRRRFLRAGAGGGDTTTSCVTGGSRPRRPEREERLGGDLQGSKALA